MELHILLEEEIQNVCCIITLVVSNKLCHLGESVYHNHDSIFPLGVRGMAMMKSLLMSSQGLEGTERGV